MYPQQQFDYRNLSGGGFNPYGQFGGFSPYGQLGGFGGFSPYGQFGGLGNLFGGASPYNDLFASFQTKLDDLFKNYQTQLNTNTPQQLGTVASENSATPKPATDAQKKLFDAQKNNKNKQPLKTKTADGTIMNGMPRVPNTQLGALRFPNGIKAGGMRDLPVPQGGTPMTPGMTPAETQAYVNNKVGKGTSSVAR